MIWLALVVLTVISWSSTVLLYKAGARDGESEEHICLKYSICIGLVFFVIALVYLATRDESFSIWESAVRFWPMTAFGIIYAIINTISFKGFVYNEASVESPIEGISGGTSTILLIIAYLIMGRVGSISEIVKPLWAIGIVVILACIVLLSIVRNRGNREKYPYQKAKWMVCGLGTLIFPVLYAIVDAMETIITGICLDKTYGYSMPEGDSIIIVGMEYSVFALAFWIYILCKEKKVYNPFTKRSAPRILGAVADNIGIVLYSYAMAINSVSTDPVLAVYPAFVMIGGRIIMKEKLSRIQYILLLGIIAGSVMVVASNVF